MTESPRKNILLMKRSLLTGLAFFLPLPVCHAHKTRRERECSATRGGPAAAAPLVSLSTSLSHSLAPAPRHAAAFSRAARAGSRGEGSAVGGGRAHHVAVAVEGLDAAKQLLVVPAVDQHLQSAGGSVCERRHGPAASRRVGGRGGGRNSGRTCSFPFTACVSRCSGPESKSSGFSCAHKRGE